MLDTKRIDQTLTDHITALESLDKEVNTHWLETGDVASFQVSCRVSYAIEHLHDAQDAVQETGQ